MAFLTLQGIDKSFASLRTIKGVDLEIERGEFVVFVGPSGCGKTTLLRLIAGLEDVSAGRIELEGRDITHVPSAKRDLAMVFQTYALYPHMTVFDNMSFALRLAKVPREQIREKVERAAAILSLTNYLQRTPRSAASRLDRGSSNRNTLGARTMARPMATRWRWPPESWRGVRCR